MSTNQPLVVPGGIQAGGAIVAPQMLASDYQGFTRAMIGQTPLARYLIPFTAWRVHDALHTLLPGAGASDDLGLVGGTFGAASPSLQTGDVGGDGALTRYARALVQLPAEYDAGQTVQLQFHAGMLTTIADTSATLDCSAYKSNREAGVGSDLVSTAAIDINSLVLADRDFTVTAGTLTPGDWLDIRVALAVNDAATVAAVIGLIGEAALLCDIKG